MRQQADRHVDFMEVNTKIAEGSIMRHILFLFGTLSMWFHAHKFVRLLESFVLSGPDFLNFLFALNCFKHNHLKMTTQRRNTNTFNLLLFFYF